MFRSARVKLTLFYLAILLAFSLTLTFSIRILAQREYDRSNDIQRGIVRHLFVQWPVDSDGDYPPPDDTFTHAQNSQAAVVHRDLNIDLILINIVALVAGGLLSYWFAGRTLRPIEEAHETQKRFAADASHELRTPLTNMKLENEVFLRGEHFSEAEARELIRSNLEEVQRLETLSTNLLDLTQIGQAALTRTKLDVRQLVADSVRQVRKSVSARKANIEQQVEAADIRGHHDSLVQLLGLVLDNALKYGPEKGRVLVRGSRHDEQFVIEIIDEGPGIDEADLPFIFDRLFRGDKARSRSGGYGLGLALAKEIAAANDAVITARNNEGAPGACFAITLPLCAD